MSKLELFEDYAKRGYDFDVELVYGEWDGPCILKAYMVDAAPWKKKHTRIPGTTIYQVFEDDGYTESVDFETLKEAKEYILSL